MKKLTQFPFLLLLAILASSSALFADDNVAALKVTATLPGSAPVRPGGSFTVTLQVENPTKEPIQFFTESCGWCQNWRTKGNIIFPMWECTRNLSRLIEIAPGGSFIDEIDVRMGDKAPAGKTTAQFGFSSIDGKQVAWSNKLEILVDPKAPIPVKKADDNQPIDNKRVLGPGCRELPWRR
jgi:hypothetical protein